MLSSKGILPWLSLDMEGMSGRVLSLPSRTDLELPFNEQQVVEYYQR
jgi:small subunit ribosomal protein S4